MTKRNYELDFLKLIFTIIVFLFHSAWLMGENSAKFFPLLMGQVSVHFFFIVSGLLMANHIAQQEENVKFAGFSACRYVLNKVKRLVLPLWVATLLNVLLEAIYIYEEHSVIRIFELITQIFPEMFLLTRSGIRIDFNSPTWYLSAMYLAMLPLAYLLFSKKDFTLYVFTPLASVLLFGYLCYANDFSFEGKYFSYLVMFEIIRAVCGLCFGVCAWTMSKKIKNFAQSKSERLFLTVTEIILYTIFFCTWFFLPNNKSIMSVQLILPIAIAITFSGRSYVVNIFRFDWMKWFAPLSLSIYLNHWAANILVSRLFWGESYIFCLAYMILFTLLFCLVNFLVVSSIRSILRKKYPNS